MEQKLTGGDLDVFTEIEAPKTCDWLHETITSFVDDEDEVSIQADVTDAGATYNVSVAPRDVAKVIGRKGQMARTLRALLQARAGKLGVRYTLNIMRTKLAPEDAAVLARLKIEVADALGLG